MFSPPTCLIAIGILLGKCVCLTLSSKNTNDKPYQQIQSILANALDAGVTRNNQDDANSLFPWKKSTTILKYHNILQFEDESEFLNNHICHCHIEKIPENGLNHILSVFNDTI